MTLECPGLGKAGAFLQRNEDEAMMSVRDEENTLPPSRVLYSTSGEAMQAPANMKGRE